MKGEIWLLISQYNGKTRFGEGINLEMATTSANISRSAHTWPFVRPLEHIRKTCSRSIGDKLKKKPLSCFWKERAKLKLELSGFPSLVCVPGLGEQFYNRNYKLQIIERISYDLQIMVVFFASWGFQFGSSMSFFMWSSKTVKDETDSASSEPSATVSNLHSSL